MNILYFILSMCTNNVWKINDKNHWEKNQETKKKRFKDEENAAEE